VVGFEIQIFIFLRKILELDLRALVVIICVYVITSDLTDVRPGGGIIE